MTDTSTAKEETKPEVSDADLLARFKNSKNKPASSVTLGFEMVALNQKEQWVEIAFVANESMLNPTGRVQGGFLSAMLDEALSIAGQVGSGMTHIMSTLEMKTSYLSAAKPGRLVARGKVQRLGRTVVFMEGEIRDSDGKVCATATATALPVEYKSNRGK
jgi:uncharacterized protein (TIGR00369 family)